MAQVRVNFVDPVTGSEMQGAQMDDQSTVQQVVDNLIRSDFVKPLNDQTKHYVLHVKGKMELNDDTKKLAEANVRDGDTIGVVVAQRGGLIVTWR